MTTSSPTLRIFYFFPRNYFLSPAAFAAVFASSCSLGASEGTPPVPRSHHRDTDKWPRAVLRFAFFIVSCLNIHMVSSAPFLFSRAHIEMVYLAIFMFSRANNKKLSLKNFLFRRWHFSLYKNQTYMLLKHTLQCVLRKKYFFFWNKIMFFYTIKCLLLYTYLDLSLNKLNAKMYKYLLWCTNFFVSR